MCYTNKLTELDVSNNTGLLQLEFGSNQITTIDLSKNTALTYLSCANSQLTSLDVSGCTALEDLFCHKSQLTSLNVSGCTALTVIWCMDNQLTSLDVSGCTALEDLDCERNQLTSLNASGCTKLQSVDCRGNQLSTINVSGCTALAGLTCLDNQLTTLDVSGCTALKNLWCSGNQLTTLDVSGCTALEYLDCSESSQLTSLNVSGCDNLKELRCHRNQLTSLDVSGFTALTSLSCDNNQLTSLNASGCTALSSLSCTNNLLTSLDVSGCTALESLECYRNQLTSLDVSGCTALTSVYCYNNKIRGAAMTALVESLPGDRTYAKLNAAYREPEGNLMTPQQVAVATGKGWKVRKYDETAEMWVDYAGDRVPADANGDGEVTAADVETISDYILGRLAPDSWFDEESADVVDDGVVDIQDLTQLIKIVLNQAYLRCPDDHHPHAIDLGLSSGTKWACCNVGADKPGSCGDYFNWDVNTVQKAWGDNWQMPSKEQMQEIIDNTTMVWTTLDGVNGLLVTGPNGGSMFLPAAGFCFSGTTNPSFVGTDGCYWTSTPDSGSNTWGLSFSKENIDYWNHSNTAGLPIRPVRK